MSNELSDTHPDIEKKWRERHAELSMAERWKRIGELNRTLRTLALSNLRKLHPMASDQELRLRLAYRIYGRDLAMKAFGPLPEEQES